MGTNECSQPASKSSWDSQDFGDVNMVLKMAHFHKSSRPQWVKCAHLHPGYAANLVARSRYYHCHWTVFNTNHYSGEVMTNSNTAEDNEII